MARFVRRAARGLLRAALLAATLAPAARRAQAHVVPPERLHPVAESFRRLVFFLNLNPVPGADVERDAERIAAALEAGDPEGARRLRDGLGRLLEAGGPSLPPAARRAAARALLESATRAVARAVRLRLGEAGEALGDYGRGRRSLEEARQIWAALEPEVRATDPAAYVRLGGAWLRLPGALGNPGLLGVSALTPDRAAFAEASAEVARYLEESYGEEFRAPRSGTLLPLPGGSPTFDPSARVPPRLPPGHDINKRVPRPRQILNMAARGVDEGETALIALGDMAFDSPFLFGEPARSLGISCNTCHNKGVTNPGFVIPGLSARPGGMDVSNGFFAPHANNGRFDPIDIPDLRGIRFTAPYGRNGRFASLREFTRNVIVGEFDGAEPDPLLLDGVVAYLLEFDFLPNPLLAPDGTLGAEAPEAARRGERLFRRQFPGMENRSCATCHVPSDHFLDRRRHDIGTVEGSGPHSLDRALDTPTLLGIRHTAPYFHDGRAPTLRAVVEWFDRRFALELGAEGIADLTAYLEAVGDGTDPVEDTVHTLASELQEFGFFLSTYEFLREKGKGDLIETTFRTIAAEIRAHKWDLQDRRHMPALDRMAELMDEALAAEVRGDREETDRKVSEYRALYQANVEKLQ